MVMLQNPYSRFERSAAAILSLAASMEERSSLRGLIQSLADAGRLVRVRERVHWRFEIGRITRGNHRPLLFENIEGYPRQRVFTNGLCGAGAIALALGLDAGTPWNVLIDTARERMAAPVKPGIVGSCDELYELVRQSKVSLLDLPVPYWAECDGGRYLGTWHVNVTKDPATGARNIGVYRMQLLGPAQATVSVSPASHLYRHFAAAEKEDWPLPMAVAIGVPEAVMIAAAAAYPEGRDEYEFAGALQQRAVELASCSSVDIEVPAASEILIEGFIRPHVRVQDGPFFDYSGKLSTNPGALLFEATRVFHRRDAIFRGAAVGMPGAEDHQLFAFLAELDLLDFHGSRAKRAVQAALLKQRHFRAFQFSGRVGQWLPWRGKGKFSAG